LKLSGIERRKDLLQREAAVEQVADALRAVLRQLRRRSSANEDRP
jgi:hypothetical protein